MPTGGWCFLLYATTQLQRSDPGSAISTVLRESGRFVSAYSALLVAAEMAAETLDEGAALRRVCGHARAAATNMAASFGNVQFTTLVPEWQRELAETTTCFVQWLDDIREARDWSAASEALVSMPAAFRDYCRELGVVYGAVRLGNVPGLSRSGPLPSTYAATIELALSAQDQAHLVVGGMTVERASERRTVDPSIQAA